jgi:hypothetical protein
MKRLAGLGRFRSVVRDGYGNLLPGHPLAVLTEAGDLAAIRDRKGRRLPNPTKTMARDSSRLKRGEIEFYATIGNYRVTDEAGWSIPVCVCVLGSPAHE